MQFCFYRGYKNPVVRRLFLMSMSCIASRTTTMTQSKRKRKAPLASNVKCQRHHNHAKLTFNLPRISSTSNVRINLFVLGAITPHKRLAEVRHRALVVVWPFVVR